jgi:TRAP-type mannitol/chloroaromatic compound transport system substrate-binding protein
MIAHSLRNDTRARSRRLLMGGAGALALGLAAALTPSVADAQKTFKLTSYVPVGSGTWNTYHKPFIDRVHDLTDGQVKIRGFSVGVLAGPFDAWKAVAKGTADMCYCFPAFAANNDPVNAIFAGLAGGMSSEAWFHWIYYGEGGDLWRAHRRETMNMYPVITGFGPTEVFLHSRRKISGLDDLKGMKIRTTGAWADILKQLGASPTVLAPGDIYTALERGVIDAAEFITPATNLKLGYHKIAKYIIFPGVHQPTHANEVVLRMADWNKLSAKVKSRMIDAGRLAAMDSFMGLGMQDLAAMKELRAGRNEWIELDPSIKAKVTELARAWTAGKATTRAAKGDDWMKRVSESYWSFYDDWAKNGIYRVN